MTDYIERDALMDAIEKLDWYQPVGKGRLSGGASSEENAVYKATDIFRVVKDVPIVDAVPVVRCRECKHYVAMFETVMKCECDQKYRRPVDFCSYGERRE